MMPACSRCPSCVCAPSGSLRPPVHALSRPVVSASPLTSWPWSAQQARTVCCCAAPRTAAKLSSTLAQHQVCPTAAPSPMCVPRAASSRRPVVAERAVATRHKQLHQYCWGSCCSLLGSAHSVWQQEPQLCSSMALGIAGSSWEPVYPVLQYSMGTYSCFDARQEQRWPCWHMLAQGTVVVAWACWCVGCSEAIVDRCSCCQSRRDYATHCWSACSCQSRSSMYVVLMRDVKLVPATA